MKINEILDLRSVELMAGNERIMRAIRNDCSVAVNASHRGIKIYKGLKIAMPSKAYLTNPKLMSRVSQNTENYYTLLMDNLPAWKLFPKRSQSLICSTKANTAFIYGHAYQIFPFDDAKIAICPRSDIWQSFPKITDTSHSMRDMHSINLFLSKNYINDSSYDEMIDSIFQNRVLLGKQAAKEFPTLEFIGKCNTKEELINGFNEIMNPKENGFTLGDIMGIPAKKLDKEVWTDSKAYMVNITKGPDIIENL